MSILSGSGAFFFCTGSIARKLCVTLLFRAVLMLVIDTYSERLSVLAKSLPVNGNHSTTEPITMTGTETNILRNTSALDDGFYVDLQFNIADLDFIQKLSAIVKTSPSKPSITSTSVSSATTFMPVGTIDTTDTVYDIDQPDIRNLTDQLIMYSRFKTLITENVLQIFISYKFYLFLLAALVALLIVCILIMIGCYFRLSRRYEKSQSLARSKRRHFAKSFDIIDAIDYRRMQQASVGTSPAKHTSLVPKPSPFKRTSTFDVSHEYHFENFATHLNRTYDKIDSHETFHDDIYELPYMDLSIDNEYIVEETNRTNNQSSNGGSVRLQTFSTAKRSDIPKELLVNKNNNKEMKTNHRSDVKLVELFNTRKEGESAKRAKLVESPVTSSSISMEINSSETDATEPNSNSYLLMKSFNTAKWRAIDD